LPAADARSAVDGLSSHADSSAIRRVVESKIDDLPDDLRVVFVLRGLEELSVQETAAALGIPQPTVRAQFSRARSQLRTALSEEIDLALDGAFAIDGARCDRIVARVMARLAAPTDESG
jgi:RNA polymerase sigma-70 factor (ECF subfamily)